MMKIIYKWKNGELEIMKALPVMEEKDEQTKDS